ncbi:MAG: hypothetical protein IJN32_08605 [Thermoguttaceae bacterium]|nr:hypothetical protein [Thermoguttaceae bacterium]
MKIFCAVSGGVDSGVAAAILKERGDDVRGLYMRHRYQPTLDADETRRVLAKWASGADGENDGNGRSGSGREDWVRPALYSVARNDELTEIAPDAAVAFWSERGLPVDAVSAFETTAFLGIPLTILDVDAPFAAVVENFVDEYFAAQTPNPCALCNRTIKFGLLDDVCRRLGGERLATGHYVRKRRVADWVAELETAAEKTAKSIDFDGDSAVCANGETCGNGGVEEVSGACGNGGVDEVGGTCGNGGVEEVSGACGNGDVGEVGGTCGNGGAGALSGTCANGGEFAVLPDWLKANGDAVFIERAPSAKDQSYFLYGVDAETLRRVEFPVGELEKSEVRQIAQDKGLPVAARKDSQEVCFVPDKRRLEFVRDFRAANPERWSATLGDTSGDFVSLDGKIIGKHAGYEKFTVGQRKGLGMGFCERIFVQRVDAATKEVVLGPYEALAVREICAVDANWTAPVPLDEDFRCEIKIRYRNDSVAATVRAGSDGTIRAIPDEPRFGVAPGQALVCYWRGRLLGGGRIVR